MLKVSIPFKTVVRTENVTGVSPRPISFEETFAFNIASSLTETLSFIAIGILLQSATVTVLVPMLVHPPLVNV